MANTPNLDLVKPAGTDHALVSVINSNSDKIDAGVGTLSEQIGDRKIKTYTALSQIGLTTGATIAQVYNALTDSSEIIEQAGNLANNGYCPYVDSMIRVTRFNSNRGSIESYSKASNAQCFLAVDNRSAPDGKWQQLATKSELKSFDLGAFTSMPNIPNVNGVYGFLLTQQVTVDGKSLPAGTRVFGYMVASIFHGIALYMGATATTLRYQVDVGWTVLQRFTGDA